jgi:hypothetical protein
MRHAIQLSFLGTRAWDQCDSGTESFDSLHVEDDAVFLLNIAARISARGVGVYVRYNKEPSGRRSSPSLERSLLPGLRGHQQQSRWRMRSVQEPLAREPGSDARG